MNKSNAQKKTLPFTCPICGRRTEHPIAALTEGAEVICPFCKLKLSLHGHMWQEVQQELAKLGSRVGYPRAGVPGSGNKN